MRLDRRTFVAGGIVGTLAAAPALARAASPVGAALAPFAAAYIAAQNAPGMIVGMADGNGWRETAAYGFADPDARRPIRPDERFHIGSITKSFTALMILQLVDEGKVALDADITRYLPDLPLKTPFGAVTVHHLLCHTSGLPGEAPPVGWADRTIAQACAPGNRFYYSNLGYEWLGRIVAVRGGEDWSRALHRRVLDPLGMAETATLIGAGMRRWEVPSYVAREDDRPFARRGALTRAAPITFTAASGSIASTAADMTRYIAMLARRGAGPNGRLLSTASFDLMVKRHVAAAEFGPDGGYGYGWMTDEVDGRPVIRHTGGMNSFMSSIHIDLAAGCGAFASINAQQNYRPVPVTAYALRLCRAQAAKASLPPPPPFDPDADLTIGDYAGDYARADGGMARVSAAGRTLRVAINGQAITLESLGDDRFACMDPQYRLLTFLFRRQKPPADTQPGERNPVLTLGWGRNTYIRPGATLPPLPEPDHATLSPAQLSGYEGLYAADGGWLPIVRVVARGGRLWIDSPYGVVALSALGGDRFRFADEAASPEIASFSPASVTPRMLSYAGSAMLRLGDPLLDLA